MLTEWPRAAAPLWSDKDVKRTFGDERRKADIIRRGLFPSAEHTDSHGIVRDKHPCNRVHESDSAQARSMT